MIPRYQTVLLAGALLFSGPLLVQATAQHSAADEAKPAAGQLIPVTAKDAAWAAEARKQYPSNQCLVSDEPLGSMGEPDDFIYRVKGQPDRLVRFCCGGCGEDFLADPAAHMAKLEKAKNDGAGKTKGESRQQHH